MERSLDEGLFERWDALPARYRFMTLAALCFLASVAAGASEFRWATPVWLLAGLGGAFLCLYAFPSVWRYLIYIGLIYVLIAAGAIMPLFYLSSAPLFIGWAVVLHILGLLVLYNFTKDVNLSRRAYQVVAVKEGKEAPYVHMGVWFLALVLFVILVDLSMLGFSNWAQRDAPITLYVVTEVLIVGLVIYLLDVPERAFGGKGVDFVPRVSLSEVTSETKKVVKKLVKRPKRDMSKLKSALIAERSTRPKVLAGGTLECPACGHELAIDARRCPECYRANEFAWCPSSEHYIIPCPHCGKPTVYGEEACNHCDHPLALDYKCPNCLKATPLSGWERE